MISAGRVMVKPAPVTWPSLTVGIDWPVAEAIDNNARQIAISFELSRVKATLIVPKIGTGVAHTQITCPFLVFEYLNYWAVMLVKRSSGTPWFQSAEMCSNVRRNWSCILGVSGCSRKLTESV